jgi:transcriptional regulator with XRE-family HTH domain
MAKNKIHARPGALMEMLKKRNMTQLEAAKLTGIDRKTLHEIDRGQEVKVETFQKLARLRVPLAYFVKTAEADDIDDPSDPMRFVMLRKLNGERLAELLKGAEAVGLGRSIEWVLNVQVVDEKARKLLKELERTVSSSRLIPGWTEGLSDQLERLESFERLGGILKELHESRLAVLGGDYVYWERSWKPFRVDYHSGRKVLLSVESSGTQSRRVPVSTGHEPPKLAPNNNTTVTVDGRYLMDIADPPISNDEFIRRIRLYDDLEIRRPINSDECSETADGVARESEGGTHASRKK